MFFSVVNAIKYKNVASLIPTAVCLGLLVIMGLFILAQVAEPKTITITASEIHFENINQEKKIEYKVEPENASHFSVKFYTENENIASFDNDVLKSVSEGETYIYAEIKNTDIKSEKIKVIVVDPVMQDVRNVIEKINAIENVTLDSKALIEDAENAYNSLPQEVQEKVTNYSTLTEAREIYNQLENVTEKINAIGSVSLTSKTAIEDAENAYNSLTPEVREKITNHPALTEARESYNQLENEKTKNTTQSKQTNSGYSYAGSDDGSQTVYVGKTGTKYHYKNCRTLKGGGRAISLSTAISQGYTPCKVCH